MCTSRQEQSDKLLAPFAALPLENQRTLLTPALELVAQSEQPEESSQHGARSATPRAG